MKFIKEFLPTIPNINILLLSTTLHYCINNITLTLILLILFLLARLILASLSILSWRFAQKEISKSFGSRVAVYHFIIEMFQIYQSDLSSRFLDVNLIKMTRNLFIFIYISLYNHYCSPRVRWFLASKKILNFFTVRLFQFTDFKRKFFQIFTFSLSVVFKFLYF